MQGYDRAAARAHILRAIDRREHRAFAHELEDLVREAIELDLAFMVESGAVDANGWCGENCYDDDEAFEYILDGLVEKHGYDEETAVRLGAFVDDYMDAQQDYMESAGLLEWE